MVYTYLVAAIE